MRTKDSVHSIIVSWAGPFLREKLSKSDEPNVLYMIAGRKKYGRKVEILYIGLTKRTAQERIEEHLRDACKPSSTKSAIHLDTVQIWVGHIQFPNPCTSIAFGLAEHYFIHFTKPVLNKRKLECPRRTACLVSQWRKKDFSPYQKKPSIHRDLPDILWWDEPHWRCGNLSVSKVN